MGLISRLNDQQKMVVKKMKCSEIERNSWWLKLHSLLAECSLSGAWLGHCIRSSESALGHVGSTCHSFLVVFFVSLAGEHQSSLLCWRIPLPSDFLAKKLRLSKFRSLGVNWEEKKKPCAKIIGNRVHLVSVFWLAVRNPYTFCFVVCFLAFFVAR